MKLNKYKVVESDVEPENPFGIIWRKKNTYYKLNNGKWENINYNNNTEDAEDKDNIKSLVNSYIKNIEELTVDFPELTKQSGLNKEIVTLVPLKFKASFEYALTILLEKGDLAKIQEVAQFPMLNGIIEINPTSTFPDSFIDLVSLINLNKGASIQEITDESQENLLDIIVYCSIILDSTSNKVVGIPQSIIDKYRVK